ncbi:hypothetical protein HanIR_Chr07g0306211 [Helianthus annuus]|nr:hypothetical protein HanIR_Chr07g0306211 [Helianthus annuus]
MQTTFNEIAINEERDGWTRGRAQWTRGHARASVQPINRSAWSSCNSSLGTPPLSHFTHHPPPSQHHHPPPSSIVHHRVCELSRDPRLIVRVLDNQRLCLPKSLTSLGEDKCLV